MSFLKELPFYTIVSLCIAVCVVSGYFIAANTFLADVIQPKSHIVNTDFSVDTTKEIAPQVVSHLYETGRRQLTVDLEGQQYQIPITTQDITIINEEKLKDFAEGPDPTKVIADGARWIAGEAVELDYTVKPDRIITQFPFDDQNYAVVDDGVLKNCESKQYNYQLDTLGISQKATTAFKQGEVLQLTFEEIALNADDAQIVELCKQSEQSKPAIATAFQKAGITVPNSLEYIAAEQRWTVSNMQEVESSLQDIKKRTDIPVKQGDYEFNSGKVFLLQPYQVGKYLNVNKTLQHVSEWLETQEAGDINLVYDKIEPTVLQYEQNLIDFTKHLGAGKTRLDIIRFGAPNQALVFAQHGLEDIHNTIIMPGEEFSYIDHIQPQPGGWTASGRPIGGGICNSTTTLFRAALEAGFPITDRSYHRVYIPSYEWPYPQNVVDAVYLTEPKIDLKFINDLQYPVLLRLTVTRPGGNWQYHTVDVLTDSRAQDRKVELFGFKTWNHVTPKQFEGEFSRKVFDNGQMVRTDTFYSRYVDDGGVN